jgi:hypothetical protein
MAALLAIAWAGTALAHDHEPPSASLTAGDKHQNGNLWQFCWSRAMGEPGFSVFYCSDGFFQWQKPRLVPAGTEASVRFGTAHVPEQVDLAYWRKIDRFDNPKGDPTHLDAEVVPVTENGEVVAYDAIFTVPSRGQFYMNAFGAWPDQEGSGQMQDASWTFHLKIT